MAKFIRIQRTAPSQALVLHVDAIAKFEASSNHGTTITLLVQTANSSPEVIHSSEGFVQFSDRLRTDTSIGLIQ